jgi:hypothetical protein
MRQNAGLLTENVSGTSMPIISSTIESSAYLVSKPGTPSGLCSAGLLVLCTASRVWPDHHFVASSWSLSYIISTMHGHTNIKLDYFGSIPSYFLSLVQNISAAHSLEKCMGVK